MPNPLISQLKVNGTLYDIKDADSRERLDAIEAAIAGGVVYVGATTTALTDGATTNPITITGKENPYTAEAGDLVSYGNKEFLFDGTAWHEIGDLTGLGDLAWVDTATGSFTPAGTVSQPTFSGDSMTSTGTLDVPTSAATTVATTTNETATVAPAASGDATYTPGGNISGTNVTLTSTTVPNVTSVGALPELTMSVPANTETLELSWSAGTLPSLGDPISVANGVDTITDPTFSGTGVRLVTGDIAVPATFETTLTDTSKNVSVTGTPAGTVSQPTFSGTAGTVTVGPPTP